MVRVRVKVTVSGGCVQIVVSQGGVMSGNRQRTNTCWLGHILG